MNYCSALTNPHSGSNITICHDQIVDCTEKKSNIIRLSDMANFMAVMLFNVGSSCVKKCDCLFDGAKELVT